MPPQSDPEVRRGDRPGTAGADRHRCLSGACWRPHWRLGPKVATSSVWNVIVGGSGPPRSSLKSERSFTDADLDPLGTIVLEESLQQASAQSRIGGYRATRCCGCCVAGLPMPYIERCSLGLGSPPIRICEATASSAANGNCYGHRINIASISYRAEILAVMRYGMRIFLHASVYQTVANGEWEHAKPQSQASVPGVPG